MEDGKLKLVTNQTEHLLQACDHELLMNKQKSGISKYDLIKVKIMSGTGDSYSILSRLIIYKMLTCIGVIRD